MELGISYMSEGINHQENRMCAARRTLDSPVLSQRLSFIRPKKAV